MIKSIGVFHAFDPVSEIRDGYGLRIIPRLKMLEME
jgi:hypothetical protein